MAFRPDRDIDLPGHGAGQAKLTPRGKIRFAWSRLTLLSVLCTVTGTLIFAMTGLVRLEAWAGESAKAQIETRLQADAEARRNVTQVRQGILTGALRKVVSDDAATESDKSVRIANLQTLRAREKKLVSEIEKHRDTLGEFEPLTLVTIGGKSVPVNNTKTGKYRPEVVAAYIQNSQEISSLLQAANKRALAEAPKNPEAIIRSDIERLLAQKGIKALQ